MAKEIPMTNHQTRRSGGGYLSFGLGNSSFFRHLDFGIRHCLRRLERDIELSHAALDLSWGLQKPNWAGQFSLFFFTAFGYG
jgi:hypothetical protein